MREHEVPTHVQAEDKVLLWFTFPQIVAVVAVCAVAYGAYHYLPIGPMAVRLAVGVLIGIVGIALTVGKIGGRGLPLVAADLLKFNLGARRYAGSPLEMTRNEPPAAAGGQARPRCGCWRRRRRVAVLDKAVNAVPARRGALPSGPTVGSASAATGTPAQTTPRPTRPSTGSPGVPSWRWPLWGCWLWSCCRSTALADDPDDEDPGLAAGRDLLRAAGPGAGKAHLHRAAWPSPATPPPSPWRAAHDLDLKVQGLRRQEGKDSEDGRQHQPDGGPVQELQPDPERPVALLHLFLGRRIGPVGSGVPEEPPDSLSRCPRPTAGCATWRSPPWNGRRGASPASSPRSASRTPGRRWPWRCTAGTSARRSPALLDADRHPHRRKGQRRCRQATGPRLRLSPMVNPASSCPSPTGRRPTELEITADLTAHA